MSDLGWTAFALAVLWCAWRYCALWYRRVYGVRLRWWAVPFAQGALIFGRRLSKRCEYRTYHAPTQGSGICPRCGSVVAFLPAGHWVTASPSAVNCEPRP